MIICRLLSTRFKFVLVNWVHRAGTVFFQQRISATGSRIWVQIHVWAVNFTGLIMTIKTLMIFSHACRRESEKTLTRSDVRLASKVLSLLLRKAKRSAQMTGIFLPGSTS